MVSRRQFLSCALVTGLAGCSTGPDNSTTPKESDSAGGATAQEEVQFDGHEAIRPDNLAVSLSFWAYKEDIRYYDRSSEELRRIEPSNGAFYSISYRVANLGGEQISDLPEEDDFKLLSKGSAYTNSQTLPDDIEFAQLRQIPERATIYRPSGIRVEEIEPGNSQNLRLLYDAPEDPDFTVEWTYDFNGETTTEEIMP